MKKYILIIILIGALVGIGWFLGRKKTETIPTVPKVATPTLEEQNQKTEELLAGMYVGKFKKNDEETAVTLMLNQDKTAVMTTGGILAEKGDWKTSDKERLTITVLQTPEQKFSEPRTLEFEYDTTAGTLELKDYDKDTWGKSGLDMSKTLDITGTTWTWLETTLLDETEVVADSKQLFSVTFGPKNTLELTTDCNKVQASYKTNRIDEMNVTLGAMTEMYCEGSQEADFLKHLGMVETFLLEGSSLRLMLRDEAGTMTFTRK
ncbi:MAG: META domain-containing protein [Candidatus Moranbacteria bacterium]|nr:META domain-containing protein [Candidatus Moranbacteria bacterium]